LSRGEGQRVESWLKLSKVPPERLLFTSPPYFGLTHYHYDQWLRLWLLGGPPNSYKAGGKYRGRFENRKEYRDLLHQVFNNAKRILDVHSTVYVRTVKQQFMYQTTLEVIQEVFPEKRLVIESQPFLKPTQTQLFGD
jgi:DNA modification methylase